MEEAQAGTIEDPIVASDDEDSAGSVSVSIGDSVSGQIGGDGDIDSYVFQGNTGETVEISMVSESIDSYLGVYLEGELIGFDDDSGGGINGFDSKLVMVLPVSGQYTIQVSDLSGVSGPYQLSLGTSSQFELLGTVSTGIFEGVLLDGGLHYYRLELLSPTALVMDLWSGDFDTFLSVYSGTSVSDVGAESLVTQNDDFDGTNSRLELELAAGDYLVEISAFNRVGTGIYTLNLAEAQPLQFGSTALFSYLGEGECRQADGNYALNFTIIFEDLNPHTEGDNAEAAAERCLSLCEQESDWCFAAELVTRDIWPAPECGLITDRGTFQYAMGPLQNDAWGGMQEIGGLAYQTYCGGDGDCSNTDWSGGVLSDRQGYHCFTSNNPPLQREVAEFSLVDEDENGPAPIEIGESLSGNIGTLGDIDEYFFFASAGEAVVIDLESVSIDSYVEIYFDGELYGANDDDLGGPSGLDSQLAIVLPQSGDYTIRVYDLSGSSTGSYQLSLNVGIQSELAGSIGPGVFEGQLPPAGVHYYHFELSSQAQVLLAANSPDFDTVIGLFSGSDLSAVSEGNFLASNDDFEGTDSLLDLLLPAGSYIVGVQAFSPDSEGPYTLTFELIELGDELDSAEAVPIALGESIDGSLAIAGDSDDFLFTGSVGEAVVIDLVSEAFDAYVELYLDGEFIDADDDGGENLNSRLTIVLPLTGTYTIRIYDLSGVSTGEYQLSLATSTQFELAGTIGPGTFEGQLPAAAIHYYQFEISSLAQVVLAAESFDFDTMIALYSGVGLAAVSEENFINFSDDFNGTTNSEIDQLLLEGSYVLGVQAFSPEGAGLYTLTLEQVELGDDEDSEGPVRIALDESASGVVGVAGDTDDFVFTGSAGDAVVIDLVSEAFDPYVELYHGDEFIDANDDGGDGLNSQLTVVLPLSGIYTIRVYDLSGESTGSYQLSLKTSGEFELVASIEPGLYGSTLSPATIQFYQFELDSQAEVTIIAESDHFDTIIALFAGADLADATDENNLEMNDDWDGTNSQIGLVLPAGTYLIGVGAFSPEGSGDYSLTLDQMKFDADEDTDGVQPIFVGDVVEGAIYPEADFDEWVFDAKAGDVIDIVLQSSDVDSFLELYQDDELLAADDDGYGNLDSQIADYIVPTTGEYVIRVRDLGNSATGSYTLSLESNSTALVFNGAIEPGIEEGFLEPGSMHFYTFTTAGRAQVEIEYQSHEYDPFLVVYSGSELGDRDEENLLYLDDDSAGGTDALIYEVFEAGSYLIEARSFQAGETGAFALKLTLETLEADEDSEKAVSLNYGDAKQGELFPAGDIDSFSFIGAAGGIVDIELSSPDFDTFMELVFEGQVIAFDDDSGDEYNSSLSEFVLPFSGEYEIWVHELGDNGEGSYTVSVDQVEVRIAPPVVIGEGVLQGEISIESNVHLYTITISNLTSLQIGLESSDFDAYLTLYRGTGAEDRNEDNIEQFDDDSGEGFNSIIDALLTPGTYLIEARPLVVGEIGAYTLKVSMTKIEGDEDDPQPPVLAYGQSASGQVYPPGDVDVYIFNGSAGDIVQIDLTSNEMDTYLEVWRAGELLASDDDGGVDLNSSLPDFTLSESGEYQIQVHDYGDDEAGSYDLRLANATPPLAVQDTLAQGILSDRITVKGQVHLFPLVIAERSLVLIDLVSEEFPTALSLYAGDGVNSRVYESLVASADSGSVDGLANTARIEQELAPGTYLVEARSADDESSGAYVLELKLQPVVQLHDAIALDTGTLNGQALNTFNPRVVVEPGAKITGMLNIAVTNTHSSDEVFPVGATPSWGDRQSSYWEIENWASPGDSQYEVTVDLTAPDEVGTYYLILAAAAELTVADIMSGTHYSSQAEERWDDADDLAAWSDEQIEEAIARGRVNVDWFSEHNVDVAASAVRIEVAEADILSAGPVTMDFDPATGDQGQRRLEEVSVGQQVQIELHVAGVEEIAGWSVQIDYNSGALSYVGNSFVPGNFVPGLVPLVDAKDDYVTVGGTLLGSGNPGEGDGLLGVLLFEVIEGFSISSDLAISEVTLRTVANGRIKHQVRSIATLSAAAPVAESSGPIHFDFDLAAGDQEEREAAGAAPGDVFTLALNVDSAPEIRGWSVRVEFDPTQLRYVPNSFRDSGFIAGLVPLVGEKTGRVDVGATVLGGDDSSSGSGELGTVSFEILDGFSERAEAVITQVSFNTIANGEVIESVRSIAVFSGARVGPPSDFSGDGVVDFADFFKFADQFGTALGDPNYDPIYDLNGDGEVSFGDFFMFADAFNSGAQAKLMALAREHIGLPDVSGLEQNFPNPFNSATTIAYHVVEPGELSLEIFDINGQRIAELVSGYHATGSYRAVWDGMDQNGRYVSSGVYFYALNSAQAREIRKMLYLK